MKKNEKNNFPTITSLLCILVFVFIAPLSSMFGIDLAAIKKQHPGFPFLLNGACLFVVGVLGIVFREQFGKANARFRKKLAQKFPAWRRMAGLSDEEVEYYLSEGFNTRMALVAAIVLAVVGAILIAIGLIVG